MIDEHEWRSVLQVARDGSFSQAAKALYMSQPALSQCVREIEEELGEEIFDRSKSPLALTEAGGLYLHAAKELERLEQELRTGVAEMRALRSGRLTIASSPAQAECYLLPALARFNEACPGIRLSVLKAPEEELLEVVAQGGADFALLYGPVERRGIETLPLVREQVLLAVPPGHKLAKGMSSQPMPLPKVSFAQLEGEPFVGTRGEEALADIFERLCARVSARPRVVFEAASVMDAVQLAASGLGIALVTDMLLYHLPLASTPLFFELKEETPERELVAAYANPLSVAAQKFIELLK